MRREHNERGLAGDLPRQARIIADRLASNGFDRARAVERNVIKLGEEGGEVAGAYLRATGQARRSGRIEDLHEEVADVILTAFSLAHALEVDIEAVIAAKLEKIHSRGWREQAPEVCGCHRHGRARCPSHYMFAIGKAGQISGSEDGGGQS